MMKPELHFDFPAGQQHTPRYFCLQDSSTGFSPPVSSGLFDDPALTDCRGTRMVGQKVAGTLHHDEPTAAGCESAGLNND